MQIKSVFSDGERIPLKYTCDGKDVNPPLEFIDVPENAKSLVLLVDDPDSPSKVWSHWVVWGISANTGKIAENSVPKGASEGMNDFGNVGYGGPCPHSGTHRYRFRLFALDEKIYLNPNASRKDVESAMKGHIIEKAILTGTYSRE